MHMNYTRVDIIQYNISAIITYVSFVIITGYTQVTYFSFSVCTFFPHFLHGASKALQVISYFIALLLKF